MKLDELFAVDEAHVIGSAVRLDEIPPQYRRLPVLGRGATTIALAKDEDTAILFTRDEMKSDWLRNGIHIVTHREVVVPARAHHLAGMNDIELWMLEMPRLRKLSPENARRVRQELKTFTEILTKHQHKIRNPHGVISAVSAEYDDEHPDSLLAPLFYWLLNYDPSQYHLDLGQRQFLETMDGEIVLVDPVVSSELMAIFHRNQFAGWM